MTRVSHVVAVVLAALSCACNPFKAEVPAIKEGIAAYDQSRFPDAEQKFDEALRDQPSSEAHLGKGAALYAEHKLPDATEQFNRALDAKDEALKARAYFDLGNTHATGGMLDKAIESYKRALEIDPADPDARYNLEWALREQEKQQKQKNGKQGDQQQQAGNQGQDGQKSEQQGGDQQKSDQQQAKNDGNGEQKGPDQPGEKKDGEDGKKDSQDQAKNEQGEQKQGEQKQGDQGQPKPDGQQAKNDGQNSPENKPDSPQGQKPQDAQNGAQGDKGEDAQANAGDRSGQQGGPSERMQPARPMNKQETAQVLDALQAGEKNLQMWRFQKKDEAAGRNAVDQDW